MFVARPQAVADGSFSAGLASGGDFAQKPSTGIVDVLTPNLLDPTVEVGDAENQAISKANGIVLYFAGGNAADDAFTWNVYAWKNENGPAELAAAGTGILGTQKVVKYPHNGLATTNLSGAAADRFWADTLVVSSNYWIKRVDATPIGSNSVGKIWFDAAGYRYFLVEIPTDSGDDMFCYFSYW
jgi:hypothetical protein